MGSRSKSPAPVHQSELQRRSVDAEQLIEEELKTLSESSNIDDLPPRLKEIKHLLWVENSPVLRRAMEEWRRLETLSASRLEQMRLRETSMKNEIFQMVGFYLVFQGVMVTAVSQSSMLHENNLWSPMLLSSLAAIGAVAGILQKSKALGDLKGDMHSEQEINQDAGKMQRELLNKGKEFKFRCQQIAMVKPERQQKRVINHWRDYILVLLYVVACTVLILLSHWRILANPGICEP